VLDGAAGLFGGGGAVETAPAVDDFLAGALGKAGLLSAQR
jgi:hypothetical protein